jgi:hypothetical protein
MGRRVALLIATDTHQDSDLRRLTAPGGDVAALAAVLGDPDVAGFEVTTLVNQPHHEVGEALGAFVRDRRSDDLALLYFTGHGLKDEDGRLYLAMTNTRGDSLLFTALAAEQIDHALTGCASRQQILILDCCYSGAFPAGRAIKGDTDTHTLERFQGRGRTVLTASDATRYSFEGDQLRGEGSRSVFTRHLVEGLRSGAADLNGDGDITLDELYSYVHDRVVEEMPQQRPKIQTDVEGRTVIARNVAWSLPSYLTNALHSPLPNDRLGAVDGLSHLHRIGNPAVRTQIVERMRELVDDDSRSVSSKAAAALARIAPEPEATRPPANDRQPEAAPSQPPPTVARAPQPASTPGPASPVDATPAVPDLPPEPLAGPEPPVEATEGPGPAPGSPTARAEEAATSDAASGWRALPVVGLFFAVGNVSMIFPSLALGRGIASVTVTGLIGLVALSFERRRDPDWVAVATLNLIWPAALAFTRGSSALLVVALVGAGLNLALCGIMLLRWRRLGPGRRLSAAITTAIAATLLIVAGIIGVGSGGSSGSVGHSVGGASRSATTAE